MFFKQRNTDPAPTPVTHDQVNKAIDSAIGFETNQRHLADESLRSRVHRLEQSVNVLQANAKPLTVTDSTVMQAGNMYRWSVTVPHVSNRANYWYEMTGKANKRAADTANELSLALSAKRELAERLNKTEAELRDTKAALRDYREAFRKLSMSPSDFYHNQYSYNWAVQE